MSEPRQPKLLDLMCREVEQEFHGSVAAHEGFSRARARGNDRETVIEVFNLPDGVAARFADFTEALMVKYGFPHDLDVCFFGWTTEQTQRSYARDLEAVVAARRLQQDAMTLVWCPHGSLLDESHWSPVLAMTHKRQDWKTDPATVWISANELAA